MFVDNMDTVSKMIDLMEVADIIAVDTETTNNLGQDEKTSTATLFDGRDWLMGISVAFHYSANGSLWTGYFPFRHRADNLPHEAIGLLKNVLEHSTLVFHNSKFDLASLSTIGIYPVGDFYDTIVMAHLCNEEMPSKSLEWLSRFILKDGKDSEDIKAYAKIMGWNMIPAEIMSPYAEKDAELTYRLFKVFYNELEA